MEEWKEYKLGDVLTIKYGKDHKRLKDGSFPVYGSGGIMRYANEYIYKGPSILIPRKGSLNNIMYSNLPFWTVDTMFWTIINEEIVNPLYLYYSIYKKDFASLNVGSAVPSLTVPVIEDVDICLPPKEIQDKIASILKSLDDKIQNNRKINENLEQQAQALFKSWFVDFEPFRDQPFVESELGMIPEGWRVGTLGEIADVVMGQSPSGRSYNENGEGTIFYQGRTEFGFRFPDIRLYTTEPTRLAEPLSTLLSVRAPVGDINVATEKCCIGRGLASIKSNCSQHSYIYYLLLSMKRRFQVYNGEGTVFGGINKDNLKGMSIVIPPISVNNKFHEIAKVMDKNILKAYQENLRLSQLRDTLLPKLMSGEIKL